MADWLMMIQCWLIFPPVSVDCYGCFFSGQLPPGLGQIEEESLIVGPLYFDPKFWLMMEIIINGSQKEEEEE